MPLPSSYSCRFIYNHQGGCSSSMEDSCSLKSTCQAICNEQSGRKCEVCLCSLCLHVSTFSDRPTRDLLSHYMAWLLPPLSQVLQRSFAADQLPTQVTAARNGGGHIQQPIAILSNDGSHLDNRAAGGVPEPFPAFGSLRRQLRASRFLNHPASTEKHQVRLGCKLFGCMCFSGFMGSSNP
jgi:hypothetical protein